MPDVFSRSVRSVRGRVAGAGLRPLPSVPRLVARVRSRRLAGDRIRGRVIVVTGASSGIGRSVALRLAELGARVVLVARGAEGLEAVRAEIESAGGRAHVETCDVTDPDAVAAAAHRVLERHGRVDVLVNNAGHSIRRKVADSLDRLHDFQRTMAVNYHGPVALTLAFVPSMVAAGEGHVVNIGTWGAEAGVMPKFAAYHASKSALAAFGRSLAAEMRPAGIDVTTVAFPLVRTPMIFPTARYDEFPALTPEVAAEWVVEAIRTRPTLIKPRYVAAITAMSAVAPRLADRLVMRMT